MILIGIIVKPDVFRTRNIIIGLVAVSFRGFSSCSCAMAFNPSGVAALSKPNMLAAMFINIDPIAGWFFGISGKRRVKTGERKRANALMRPAFSPIFMMPSHKANTPVRPIEISKADFDEANVESIKAGNTDVSPKNINFINATMKPITKKATQI